MTTNDDIAKRRSARVLHDLGRWRLPSGLTEDELLDAYRRPGEESGETELPAGPFARDAGDEPS